MAYYRTEEGEYKKQLLNSKRSKTASTSEQEKRAAVEEKRPAEEISSEAHVGSGFDGGMVVYLAMVTSLIEGRAVSLKEVLEMLQRTVRQHSMARGKRADYVVWHLNKHPP